MTTGERIQSFRKLAKISGAELSKMTGISHTIIRKYETNRSVPKLPQIYKIAEALNVSPSSITGNQYEHRFKTLGDFFGVLITLYKSGVIWFDGARNPESKICASFEIKVNPFVSGIIDTENQSLSLESALSNDAFNNFLIWEMYNERLKAFIERYNDRHANDEVYKDTINSLNNNIEQYEIKLLYSQEKLENIVKS